ncbi:MAG TPA: preprotein translocase subunit SecA, partial [bacterium]|nr:preprotein translocase subunit SecA [bacterium]
MSIFDRVFGGFNKKQVTRYSATIDKINRLEDEYRKLSSSALKEKTAFLKKELETGKSLGDILPFAFANAREGARRIIGQRAFDTQLIGGIVLHEGKIAEMKTGEGKTLTAIFPLYLNALVGKGAHLVTVNDYLAKRDAEWMGKVYHALGLSVSVIQNQGVSYVFDPDYTPEEKSDIDDSNPALIQMANLRPCSRKEAYACDITYGTNNEFGFDYLRDNMARSPEGMVQRELHFAIVDEVDSILIDEARTPLIISAPARQSASLYMEYATIARRLKPEADLTIDEKDRAVNVTDEGISKVERLTGIKDFYSTTNVHLVHHLEEALKAQFLFTRDKDYVVKNGEVIIVDEFTGRMMPGRRYSEGLHQAIEAKEGVEVQKESETLATISFQNLFRLYDKLSGMTGTAETEAEEFYKIYKLDVVVVPTNKPMVRKDKQDLIYKTVDGKYNAIAEKIEEVHKRGQPVLVGTVSIEKSEKLSKLLRQRGIKHEVLNAKHHEREAAIIAQAGRPGAVTVATNMAGRGVDIVLGGSPLNKNKRDEVMEAGGLFVLGTERHESRRIDNQLRGRSGRQGDPGESRFYISLEDDLMRIFGGERLKNMMERLGLPDDQPIENKMISRAIESAQRRVEGHNFDIRKHLVEYDDVMNKHREVIYSCRRKILCLNYEKDDWLHEKILDILSDEEKGDYKKKIKQHPPEVIRQIERAVWLQVIDRNWINHLNSIEHLRTSIGLRGYGQVDPLVVYKQEAFQMFERLLGDIDNEIAETMLRLEIDGPS